MMALPANNPPLASDASATRKFYTLTASLREIYDDNVNTTHTNPQTSLDTDLAPSVLVDFPMEDSDFSARYTFDMLIYGSNPNNGATNGGGSSNSSSIQYSHEFVAQYAHAFSDRFNLNLAESLRYFIQPSILESTGTNYQNGPYVSNTLNGTATAQWTPLFGTTTTYANTIVKYDNAAVALGQNSTENTGSQTFSFSILPKISLSVGGIGDDITYDSASRGYTTYTGFIGGQWQALPSLSVTARGGGTYIEPVQSQGQSQGQASFAPYVAITIPWTLGARSSLSFDYAHEITPSDQTGANGQTSDRFSASFRYDITARLSSHLQGVFTHAVISSLLTTSGSGGGYSEDDYYLDTGLTYHYNTYLDFNAGVTLSGVSSEQIIANSYERDQVYLGVRGTY
jgi:hypothetical protein